MWLQSGGFEIGGVPKHIRFAAIAENDDEDDEEQRARQVGVACPQVEILKRQRDREILSVDRGSTWT